MNTLKLFFLSVLESLEFGRQVIRYALVFVSAFCRERASMGCDMVAMRSQLTFYEESIRQKRLPHPRFHPAFRLLWVLLSRVWSGWKSAAGLMKPKTVLKWHEDAFLQWCRWKSRRKGPTLRFQILYIFVILNHSRRQVVHFAVTAHPTMAWVIQQLREAMPFGQQPTYLFRDNDGIYGDEVGLFLLQTGIEEVKTAHRCPWQDPFVERYGGTLRRELLDHVIVLNEEHLKRLLKEFIEEYYHPARPHQGLNGDTPVPSATPVADVSRLVSIPVVGGLHHRYIRVAA